MLNEPSGNNAEHCTVRDLVQREYKRHKLRRSILDHDLLDTLIEIACLNRDEYLKTLSKLQNIGPKP